MRRLIQAACAAALLLLVTGQPILAQEWIADIKTAPQRYVNREVTVVGQVMATTSIPAGTTRGIYVLMDDSDPTGIGVRTRDLPAPGHEFSVVGVVTQDPQTGDYLITESSRTVAGRPAWLLPVLIGLALLVVVLVVMLLRSLSRGGAGASGAAPTVRPGAPAAAPTVRPTASPPPTPSASGPTAAAPEGEATEVLDTSEATEIFQNLGASLEVTGGPDAGKAFPLGKEATLIGRTGRRANDVALSDTAVSREQAKIMYNADTKTFTLVNESKTNPSQVDGVTVDAKQLEDGAVIEFGKTTIAFRRS